MNTPRHGDPAVGAEGPITGEVRAAIDDSIDPTWGALRERIEREPEAFSFLQLVRWLELEARARAQAGQASEPLRFRGDLSLAFPPSEVRALEHRQGIRAITVSFLSLGGQGGPLPALYTQALLEAKARGEGAGVDLLDLFHHPLISAFYRASVRHRSLWTRGAGGGDICRRALGALMGRSGALPRPGAAAGRSFLGPGVAPGLGGGCISFGALKGVIGLSLGEVPHQLHSFEGRWLRVHSSSRGGLGSRAPALGQGASLGARVWDVQGQVRLEIGPLSLEAFLDYLPGSKALESLLGAFRGATGGSLGLRIELHLSKGEAPPMALRRGPRLGRSAWLGRGEGTFSYGFSPGEGLPGRGGWHLPKERKYLCVTNV